MQNDVSPRQWRINKKMTLERAATLVGVRGKNPARTWQRWETGELQPPLHVVDAIAVESDGAVTLQSWLHLRQPVSAPSNPSPDSTAFHTGAASPDPIPETAGLPAIAPAHAGVHKQGVEVAQ